MRYSVRDSRTATAIGLLAPLFWGMSVGIVKSITDAFGLASGLVIFYTATCLFLLMLLGRPRISRFSKKFLLFGMPWANIYSILFCTSLYLAADPLRTLEAGMVNYLWPCLVILAAVVFNGQKARWWLLPGAAISFAGIAMVLGGGSSFTFETLARHLSDDPLPCLLAFLGAVSWALYSNAARAWSKNENPTLLVFLIDAAVFTGIWIASGEGTAPVINAPAEGWISIALGALTMGSSYAAWTLGVSRGSIALLSIASYFTPVLSCLFAAAWLGAELTLGFGQGVAVVVAGSLLCWTATLDRFNGGSGIRKSAADEDAGDAPGSSENGKIAGAPEAHQRTSGSGTAV